MFLWEVVFTLNMGTIRPFTKGIYIVRAWTKRGAENKVVKQRRNLSDRVDKMLTKRIKMKNGLHFTTWYTAFVSKKYTKTNS